MNKFLEQLKKNRSEYPPEDRWRVVLEDNNNGTVTEFGSTYAITEDGDIRSLSVPVGGKERGSEVLQRAILEGGTKCQAFGKVLFNFYTKNGFVPIAWVKFDNKKAPVGWDEYGKEEPLIFYAFDERAKRRNHQRYIPYICLNEPKKSIEEAVKERDEWINNKQRKEIL